MNTWRDRVRESEQACRLALEEPELARVGPAFERVFPSPEDCYLALARAGVSLESAVGLEQIAHRLLAPPHAFERWMLLRAAQAAFPRLATWRVTDDLKACWADEALFFAQPPKLWLPVFIATHVRFREMARVATLQRYPAGQFHWEVSGLPRSWMYQAPVRDWWRVSKSIMIEMRGTRPVAEVHVNDRRKNRLTLSESEALRSYYRLARSLELQPELHGLITCSWLYCPATAILVPRIAWLREFFLSQSAVLFPIGPAPADSGFMVGSEERRRLYEEGSYRPTMTCVIWPRRQILAWAKTYSDPDPAK
jgi:hypothetical protein